MVLARLDRVGAPGRVLMTADTIGGVWSYAVTLARGLAARGATVGLATMGRRPDAAQRSEALAIPRLQLFESDFRLEWMDDPWTDVARAGEWLMAVEQRFAPDVVHLNNYAHGSLPWRAPVVVAAHSCVYSWFESVLRRAPDAAWDRYRDAVRTGLGSADAIVAPTGAMLDAVERHYGVRGGRVIPNAGTPRPAQAAGRRPIVFSCGRLWDDAKNVEMLARVAPLLPWPVVVAGETGAPDGGRAGRYVSVRQLGPLPHAQVLAWMRRASIYALPARYEPFGLSALEATNAGCALALGDIASLREVWGDAAILLPCEDTAAWLDGLRRLIASQGLRVEMAGRARARARVFTIDRMVASYLTLYQALRRTRRPASRQTPQAAVSSLN